MESAVEHLVRLGLREYEAKCYVALVGLGEANVRQIHEVSGVPRPRVYDVLDALDKKGFIEVRQGSPLMYNAVRPDVVVSFLKKDLDTAASESVKALEALSVDAQQDYSPIWYVHSDRAIQRNLEMLVEGMTRELIVICFDTGALEKFQEPLQSIAKDRVVKVLFPEGVAQNFSPVEGVRYFEAGPQKDFFGVNVFGKIFSAPIRREGALFRLECILVADDRESMLIYAQDGKRMAVILTLPFITCVQSTLFSRIIGQAHEIARDGKSAGELRKTGNKSEESVANRIVAGTGKSMKRSPGSRSSPGTKGEQVPPKTRRVI